MKSDLYSELFGLIASLDDHKDDVTLGGNTPMASEPVRFINESSLSFIGQANSGIEQDGEQFKVKTALFGLLGPIGSLPYVYSEIVSRADRANDPAMRDFFDILSHRSTSLMYRAWRKNRMWLEHHPGAVLEKQRKISQMIEGFAGISALPERIAWLDIERDRVLFSADVFPRRVRNANGLRQLLVRQFGMDFRIEEFVGNWEPLPEEARSGFSQSGTMMRLGYNTIIGSRTWQVQSNFRVVISFPTAEEYRKLQPGSESLRRIQLTIRLYCTPDLASRIQIIVRGDVIAPGKLGDSGESGVMLGWNTVAGAPDKNKNYTFSICRDYNQSRMST